MRWEGVEEGADALPCGVDGSLGGFAQQQLELGEDLFDRIEVGRVGRQDKSLAPAERMALRIAWPLWLPRLSMMTMSPGLSVGTRNCSTQAVKLRPLIGPSSTYGASIRSWRRAARKVSVRHLPKGARATSFVPRGAQPRIGVMLVLAQVSSMNTSRRGSSRP